MAPTAHRCRIHLLAAKEAPIVVILQRKRTKLFHVIAVHTEQHWVDEGSSFRGVLYAMYSDVSFDGKFMVYLARGGLRASTSCAPATTAGAADLLAGILSFRCAT